MYVWRLAWRGGPAGASALGLTRAWACGAALQRCAPFQGIFSFFFFVCFFTRIAQAVCIKWRVRAKLFQYCIKHSILLKNSATKEPNTHSGLRSLGLGPFTLVP